MKQLKQVEKCNVLVYNKVYNRVCTKKHKPLQVFNLQRFTINGCGDGGSRTRVRSAERTACSMRSRSIVFADAFTEATHTSSAIVELFHPAHQHHYAKQSIS